MRENNRIPGESYETASPRSIIGDFYQRERAGAIESAAAVVSVVGSGEHSAGRAGIFVDREWHGICGGSGGGVEWVAADDNFYFEQQCAGCDQCGGHCDGEDGADHGGESGAGRRNVEHGLLSRDQSGGDGFGGAG